MHIRSPSTKSTAASPKSDRPGNAAPSSAPRALGVEPQHILQLQQRYGNRAVAQLLRSRAATDTRPASGEDVIQGVFQYVRTTNSIVDLGRSEEEFDTFYKNNGLEYGTAWSSDGVLVYGDVRNLDMIPYMPVGGAAQTSNYVHIGSSFAPQLVTAEQFNQWQAEGFFDLDDEQRFAMYAQTTGENWNTVEQNDLKDTGPGGIHIASVGAPTHKADLWEQFNYEEKLKMLTDAMDMAFVQWQEGYDEEATYIFTAPEYYFSGKDTHYLPSEQAQYIYEQLTAKLSMLPSNVLVIPGTIGWQESMEGQQLDEYMQQHNTSKGTLMNDMNNHGLSYSEKTDYEYAWGDEPQTSENPANIYHNTAYIYQGGQDVARYDKRYESMSDTAPDRSRQEKRDGFFHIGTETFETTVNDIPIRLEICSDNSGESIQESGYDGVHILLAADFGDTMDSTLHGQTYIHTDSSSPYVRNEVDVAPAKDRYHAGDRNMPTVTPSQKMEHTEGGSQVTLSFYRVAKRTVGR